MRKALILISFAGLLGVLASRVMWWAGNGSRLPGIVLGPFVALAFIILIVLFGYFWVWLTGPF